MCFGKDGLDLPNFVAVLKHTVEGNRFNLLKRLKCSLIDTLQEPPDIVASLVSALLIKLLIFALASSARVLNGLEEDIHERILKSKALMCSEANQVKVAVVIGTPGNLQEFESYHCFSVEADTLGREVKQAEHRFDVAVEVAYRPKVIDGALDLEWFRRLRNSL